MLTSSKIKTKPLLQLFSTKAIVYKMGGSSLRDNAKLRWFTFETCFFCFLLASGTILLGILFSILGVLWIIASVFKGGCGFIGLLTGILSLIIGVLILVGYQRKNAELLWYSVYILLVDVIWLIISAIVLFVFLLIVPGIFSLLNAIIIFLCACLVRSTE